MILCFPFKQELIVVMLMLLFVLGVSVSSDGGSSVGLANLVANQDTTSVMSFHSSNGSSTSARRASNQHLGTKVINQSQFI